MNRKERILKYINSSDDFVVNGKRYCENDFYNDVEDLVKENKLVKEVIEKAIEYMKDVIFEPLLTNQDRKLIMYNDNLRNFEKILKEVE